MSRPEGNIGLNLQAGLPLAAEERQSRGRQELLGAWVEASFAEK